MQTVRSVEKAKVLRLIYRWLAMFEQEPVARMIRLAFIIIYGQARRPSAKSAKLANLNGLLRRAVDGRRVIRRCCSMALSVDSKRVEELWFALKKFEVKIKWSRESSRWEVKEFNGVKVFFESLTSWKPFRSHLESRPCPTKTVESSEMSSSKINSNFQFGRNPFQRESWPPKDPLVDLVKWLFSKASLAKSLH